MGRTGLKSPSFSLRRVSSHVRARSQRIQVESTFDSFSKSGESNLFDHELELAEEALGKRIMVVIDSTMEAKSALQWTLSHSVLNQDTIVLVCVTKSSKQVKESNKKANPKVHELLNSMKDLCLMERPQVHVEIAAVEGKDKGPTIVNEVKKQGVSLLVLGQRKRSMMWRAVMMWRRNRSGSGVAEHCIKNAKCMTVAVRKKRRMGGYLITTRRHKDFWLLA